MNLLIEIRDGLPVNHPVDESNLINAFPDPEERSLRFVPFRRVLKPEDVVLNFGEKWKCEYKYVDDCWQDVWSVVAMPQEELEQITSDFLQDLNADISELSQIVAIELQTETNQDRIVLLQQVVSDLSLIDTSNKNLGQLLEIRLPRLPPP